MLKKVIFLAVISFFLIGTAQAQSLKVDMSAGWGTKMGEETDMFTSDSMFGAFHVDVLGFDFMDASSGVGIEVGFGGDNVRYSLWSLNRVSVTDRIYGGSDMKFIESDAEGTSENFDLRLVQGTRLGQVGPGELKLEIYLIEENRPVSFALLYDW